MKRLGGISGENGDGLLGDNGAAVAFRADKMHGRAGELDTVGQRRFMDMQSVEALPAEGRDQGGVDVHNGVGVGLHQLFGEDDHAARQNH